MPIRLSKSFNQLMVMMLLGVALAFLSCRPRLPATWQNDVPGVYAGDQSGFREVIEFKADGTFHHQVFRDSKPIHLESGKWRVPPGKRTLVLEPFTEFYHAMTREFSADGKSFELYYFSPLPDGKSFNMIASGAEYEFRLVREANESVKHHP